MNEAFLSYLWRHRHLNRELKTEAGDELTILHPGDQNTDSGPDFFNARIRIGHTTWAGNVEIHVQASDWYKHGHDGNPAYDRSILHVVYEPDQVVYHQNGEPIQTLVIRNQFPGWIYDRYRQMMRNQQWIPCLNQLNSPGDPGIRLWMPALATERLVYKANNIRQLLTGCGNDWEEAFYRHLACTFGFNINNLAFELLAKSLPLKIVRKHCENMFEMEALLFGQAGMLETDFNDLYPWELRQEYHFLRRKYNLGPVPESTWKFLRLRPPNFPTIRISQFAAFLCSTGARFFNLFGEIPGHQATEIFRIAASAYWDTHYVFGKPAASGRKMMGETGRKLLVINGLAPFLFFYGTEKDQPSIRETALEYLEWERGEDNVHIQRWKEAGFPADNAMQTQALLHLKHFYCDKKQCLECRVGSWLLTRNGK